MLHLRWHGRGVRQRSAKACTGVRIPLPPPNYFRTSRKILDNSSKINNKGFNNLAFLVFRKRHTKSPSITEFGYFLATLWLHIEGDFLRVQGASSSISHLNFQELFNKGDLYDGRRSIY